MLAVAPRGILCLLRAVHRHLWAIVPITITTTNKDGHEIRPRLLTIRADAVDEVTVGSCLEEELKWTLQLPFRRKSNLQEEADEVDKKGTMPWENWIFTDHCFRKSYIIE